jgi:CubicO group peptidase (beta-lactamase class C family)
VVEKEAIVRSDDVHEQNMADIRRMKISFCLSLLSCLLMAPHVACATQPTPSVDPQSLMKGFPPHEASRIHLLNWQAYPQKIWSFQHVEELFPTRRVRRSSQPQQLPQALRPDLFSALTISLPGEPKPLSWLDYTQRVHTDAVMVIHKGRIIEERYLNGMTPERQHLLFSATKSFVGLMAMMLMEEGKLQPDQSVKSIIPELSDSAWGDATIQQVADMTDSVRFTEVYTDPKSDIFRYVGAMGWAPQLRDPKDPSGILAMLPSLKQLESDPRGTAFRYRSPATDVLAWVCSRAANQSVSHWIQRRLWEPLGATEDGFMMLDPSGTEVSFAGFNATLSDLGKLGQAMLVATQQDSAQQVIPSRVARALAAGGSREAYRKSGREASRPDHSYRAQFWVHHGQPRHFYMGGAFGQRLVVYPDHDLVIVHLGSHPSPSSSATDALHLEAARAVINALK